MRSKLKNASGRGGQDGGVTALPAENRQRVRSTLLRTAYAPVQGWRYATAALRPLPDVVIIGAQRSGTTSMHMWLCSHPAVAPFKHKELHYFDVDYDRGERWYRTHYPIARGTRSVESSPYMLFHPLAPSRAGADLPAGTRFIALLRDPVERAISHYWHEWRLGRETEPLEVALALEDERMAGQNDLVERGEKSFRHRNFSYRARGHYAQQLRRWFEAVGRDRILVVESEELFGRPEVSSEVLDWLCLESFDVPFPAVNDALRERAADVATQQSLRRHFAPHNEELFELLGRRMWNS